MPVSCFCKCLLLCIVVWEYLCSSLIFIPNCGPKYLFYISPRLYWCILSSDIQHDCIFLLVKIIAYCSFVKQYCYLFSNSTLNNVCILVHGVAIFIYLYYGYIWHMFRLVYPYFLCLAFPYSVTVKLNVVVILSI